MFTVLLPSLTLSDPGPGAVTQGRGLMLRINLFSRPMTAAEMAFGFPSAGWEEVDDWPSREEAFVAFFLGGWATI